MTDQYSQRNGWTEGLDDEAPTHMADQGPQQYGGSQNPSAVAAPQGYQPVPYSPGPTGPSGASGNGSPSYGSQYGQPQYNQAPHGNGQYGAPQYGPPPGGHPAQFGGYQQPGMYPSGPAIPGVTVDAFTGEPLSDKSKVAAGFLQFFLGCFGAGRFYIGDTTIGAIQLGLFLFGLVTLFFVVGIFIIWGVSLWAFVDAILMWTGSVRDSQGRKLR